MNMTSSSAVIGRSALLAGENRLAAGVAGLLACLVLTGCAGDMSERSVAEFSGSLAIPEGIQLVRLVITNGTVGMDIHSDHSLSYAGGVRRAANTVEDLRRIEAIPLLLTAEPDPADPTTLVVRGPEMAAGAPGLLALELGGLRLPADIAVEIQIGENGHVTLANRKAAMTVSTGRGDLRFEACQGAIKARTGRGNVIAFDHQGDIEIQTAVGDMQVFVREPGLEIQLDTGEGTVQCYIPPTSGFRLDSRAQIGRCGSSFGFPVENPSDYSAAMTGSRGDEKTKIVLRTGKGHLSLGTKTFK